MEKEKSKGKAVFLNEECLLKMNDIKTLMYQRMPEMKHIKTSVGSFLTACLCVLEAYMQNEKK